MKNLIVIFMLILSTVAFAQEKKVITVYRSEVDVKEMISIGSVEGSASKYFGNIKKLRAKAIAEAQRIAEAKNADAILIIKDSYVMDPVNKVSIVAIAYRIPKEGEVLPGEVAAKSNPYEDIRKLKKLLDDGLITQEEYDKEKKEILDKN